MGDFNKELKDRLAEFIVVEVGSKLLDGVTYVMLLKQNQKDMELYKKYIKIKETAIKCGYNNDEIFRIHELSNGYILDVDLNIAKSIIAEVSKFVDKANDNKINTWQIIGDSPEKRRKKDITLLAKYLKSNYDRGINSVEVALFSKNTMNTLTVNARNNAGELIYFKFRAYAIRPSDIEVLNEKFLVPSGFRVKSVQAREIFPSRNGVGFVIQMESMKEFNEHRLASV